MNYRCNCQIKHSVLTSSAALDKLYCAYRYEELCEQTRGKS